MFKKTSSQELISPTRRHFSVLFLFSFGFLTKLEIRFQWVEVYLGKEKVYRASMNNTFKWFGYKGNIEIRWPMESKRTYFRMEEIWLYLDISEKDLTEGMFKDTRKRRHNWKYEFLEKAARGCGPRWKKLAMARKRNTFHFATEWEKKVQM